MRLADDAKLRRVLEACTGFRTFEDVVTKAGFLFLADDAIEYDPKAVKRVLEKNDGEGYATLEKLLPEFEKLEDWSAESLTKLLETKQEDWNVGFGINLGTGVCEWLPCWPGERYDPGRTSVQCSR